MTGYIYLLLSKLSVAVKMVAMKNCATVSEDAVGNSIRVNTVRAAICTAVSAIIALVVGKFTPNALWVGALSGLSNGLNMFTWILCAGAVSLCVVEIFGMLGSVVIPLLAAPFLYPGETVLPLQWLGCGLLLGAVILFTYQKKEGPAAISVKTAVYIFLCTISSTGVNMTQKLYVSKVGSGYSPLFNLITFVVVLLFFLTATVLHRLWKRHEDSAAGNGRLSKRTLFWILVASVTMYSCQLFQTMASGELPSAILYPMTYGLGFFFTAVLDTVIFKVPLTPRRLIATMVSIAGLILIVI